MMNTVGSKPSGYLDFWPGSIVTIKEMDSGGIQLFGPRDIKYKPHCF